MSRFLSVFLLLLISVAGPAGCASTGGEGEEEGGASGEGMKEAPRRANLPAFTAASVLRGRQDPIEFAGLDWKLTSAQRQQTAAVATYLKVREERVIVAGGAEAASPEYARQLGQQRALAVKEALMREGIPASRISTVSFGQDLPGKGADRVEFGFVPNGEKGP